MISGRNPQETTRGFASSVGNWELQQEKAVVVHQVVVAFLELSASHALGKADLRPIHRDARHLDDARVEDLDTYAATSIRTTRNRDLEIASQ